MNRKIDFTHLGGLHTYQDTLDYLQTAYSQSSDALAKFIGDKVILTGAEDQGAVVTEGWISYGGEILPFTGGLKGPYIVVEQIVQDEAYEDAVQRPVYYTRRLKFGNVIGETGGFAYGELARLPFNSFTINSALINTQTIIKSIINFENEVILDGCNVDETIPGVTGISAGVILFGGKLTLSPAYSGITPAYISEAGLWSTEVPATGLYIKFDPHTSKRYRDVLRRFTHQSGDLLFSKVLSDRFDPVTGIGKWEWDGFKLSEDMRGRVPVGLWFGANGAANIYESLYRGIGNEVGENRHKLTKQELPAYQMESEIIGDNGYPNGSGDRGGSDQYLLSPTASNKNPRRLKMNSGGSDDGHENRQPSRIVAIIERI